MNIILFSDDDKCGENCFEFKKNDERYRHCKKILRLSEGSFFKSGLINSQKGKSKILKFDTERLLFDFTVESESQSLFPLHIVLGLPRPIQLKRCIKDLTTLGVSTIHLVPTELGEASYLNSTLLNDNAIRTYLIEGACQAGSTLLPKVFFYKRLLDCPLVSGLHNEGVVITENGQECDRIVLDLGSETVPLTEKLKSVKGKSIVLAIGNERGWTENERKIFAEKGFAPCSIGQRILKTETAVIAASAITLSALYF